MREERFEERLQEEIDQRGELEPPWARYPAMQLGSIGWRMGIGERYLDLFGYFVETRMKSAPVFIEHLQRHPAAPVPWTSFLIQHLAALDKLDEEEAGTWSRLHARVLSEGLTAPDAAYPVFVRNELRRGGVAAPWSNPRRDPLASLRYSARELGFWARWLHAECPDRAAWLEAAPPAPAAWRPIVEGLSSADQPEAWSDLGAGPEPLVLVLGQRGTIPPPWTAGHPPIEAIDWEIDADLRHAWAWWAAASFDDPESFAAYLDRWPPPPEWDVLLRDELFSTLFVDPDALF